MDIRRLNCWQSEGNMAVKTTYKHVPYDLTKGQMSVRGKAKPQGMIPRRLVDLRYEGNDLTSRPTTTAFATGVYSASYDISGTGSTTDGALITDAQVTNICSDGARIFGQTTISLGTSSMPDPGQGTSDFVVELKDINGTKTWCLTDIPAPRAATPLASTNPYSGASFNSGTGDSLLLTNFNYLTRTDSPDFFVIDNGVTVNDPAALKKSAVLARFPGLAVTRAAGQGYTVSYDSVGTRYIVLKHDGLTIQSWALLTTTSTATVANATRFDALMIGDDLYLAVRENNIGISMYRYDMTSGATPIVGSLTGTPTSLAAAAQSSYALAGNVVRAIAISSQSSPTEFRLAFVYDNGGAGTCKVVYLRRNLLTLAAVAAYTSGFTGGATAPILNITCNGNIVLAEWHEGGGLWGYTEFGATAIASQYYPQRDSGKVYAYVYDGGTGLTEIAVFPTAVASNLLNPVGETTQALQTYLYSHISSNGHVAIGDCVYQIIEISPSSPGVKKVQARFIAKVLDFASSGMMYGDTTTTPTPTFPRPMRESNSLCRWVGERYVALPLGADEQASYWYDGAIGASNGPAISGLTSNERAVVYDIEPLHLTATELRQGVTALGHGFVVSTNGEIGPWCSVSRPIVNSITPSFTADTTASDWIANEVISYRAVAVVSIGGLESYIASASASYTMPSAGTDLTKSVSASVMLNGQCPAVSKIRIYRSRSQLAGNEEFHFLTEVDPPVGAADSVTFVDNRADLSARPIDPTGGGSSLQGNFASGLRDVTSASGRVYVATHDAAVPCQLQLGDDVLPTPLVDYLVQIPSSGGRVKHVSQLYDSVVVSSENAVYGLAGEPPGTAGGNEIVAFVLSEGTGCNGKPVATPAGLMIPRLDGILLVDRSRNVQEIFGNVEGDESGAAMTLSGRCAYSVDSDEVYFVSAVSTDWLVLSGKSARWTEWESMGHGVATINRGALLSLVAGEGVGWLSKDSATYANPEIWLGWDSFPDRFSEAKVKRILLDGYRGQNEPIVITTQAAYNLDRTLTSAITTTIPTYETGGRDTQGFRAQMSPARRSGSSFMFVVILTPESTANKLSIDTIAVEVLEEVKHYSAGGE